MDTDTTPKRLYYATVHVDLYVVAASERDAEELAERHYKDVPQPSFVSAESAEHWDTPVDWLRARPFGGDGVRTVDEYLQMQTDDETPATP